MTLTNLKTVKQTVLVTSVKLTTPADRIGLGFGAGQANAYPADSSLSHGRFPTPHNPEPEQFRSRQEQSATPMRMLTRTDGTDVPDAVPPASLVGSVTPGCSADRVTWRITARDISWNRDLKVCVSGRSASDCQSLARLDEKQTLARKAISASAAGK
jgi:hypothetical protein